MAERGIKIATLIFAGTLVSVVVAGIIGVGMFSVNRDYRDVLARERFADAVVGAAFQLTTLTGEYVLNPEDRAKSQWISKHKTLGELLGEPGFSINETNKTISRLRRHHSTARSLFVRILESFPEHQGSEESSKPPAYPEKRLVAELQSVTQAMVSQATLLQKKNNAALDATIERTGWIILGFILMLTAMMVGLWFVMAKRIVGPLRELARGIRVFGENPDHRLRPGRADEIGEVANAFNEMAQKLLETLVSKDELTGEVAEHNRTEASLRKSNRAFKTLSECRQTLVRVDSEEELFSEMCRIVVEHGGYRLAWIGLKEKNEDKSVKPVAQHGFENGYLKTLDVTWADTERGRGPTGKTIRTGKPAIARDIPNDPESEPWRAEAVKRGYASSIALPLDVEAEVVGAFNIYAAEINAFDDEEIRLLQELAQDISFGIQTLRQREHRLRAEKTAQRLGRIIESSLNEVYTFDARTLKFIDVNAGARNNLGYSMEEMRSLTPVDFKPEINQTQFDALLEPLRSGKTQSLQFVTVHERKDGSEYPVELFLQLSQSESPPVFVAIALDITRRVQDEKKIKDSEARKQNILKNALDAIITIEEDGRVIETNPSAERIFGFSGDELRGENIADHIIPRDLREMHLNALARIGKTGKQNIIGQRFETRGLRRDGTEFPIEMTLSQTNLGHHSYFTAFIRDMSERALADEQLRKLSLAVEQSPASVVITDLSGTIEYVNSKFVEVTGYQPADAIGQNPRMLQSGLNPPEIYKELWKNLSSGREWRGFFCNRKKNGELFWESATIAPLKDPEGDTTHYIAVKEDITERRLTEEALRKAQKMDAVGKLAGGIAHDFNNILGIVMGNLEILQRLISNDPKALGRVDVALKGARRGARLTKGLLGFSSQETGDREVASVNDVITDLDEFITRSLTEKIEVKYCLGKNIWSVEVDTGDLGDTIVNLAINARDAMPDGGDLIIETANKDLDEHYAQLNPEVTPGEYVMVSVRDTGTGMTSETIDRIFEPFFSTKEKDKGTGLGLAMVYGFVKRSSGHVSVHSELGHGSEFRILLPRSFRNLNRVKTSDDAAKTLPRGRETVLVVDDENAMVEVSVNHLTELGYQTLTANNGHEALEILNGNRKIDLLFSDVIMPGGIDGFQLARKALMEHPKLKILLTSGFAAIDEKSKFKNDSLITKLKADLMSKPYNKRELAENVRRILDEKQSNDG